MPLNTQSLDRILRTETTVSAVITGNTAFTLPSAANMAGKLYTIYNPAASTANVLVNASDASLVVTVQPGTAAVVTPISDTPVTNAAWMVVSNGVNASGVKGKTDGVAVAAGYVGEVITFTAATIAATAGWVASATLGTLTPGTWVIHGSTQSPASATAGAFVFRLATNNNSDATGFLGDGSGCQYIANAVYGVDCPLTAQTISVSVNTPIYGKCTIGSGTATVTVGGIAVRIA